MSKAIADTELVGKEFDEKFNSGKFGLQLDDGEKFKVFDRKSEDTSIDSLTNISSADILASPDSDLDSKTSKCEAAPESPGCEDFLSIGDSDKTEFNVSAEMRLKKEIEKARISKLKDEGREKLSAYLEKNGYLKLKEQLENNELEDPAKMAAALDATFDAKREATLQEIGSKLGRRQISEDNEKDKDEKKKSVVANITEAKSEKTRMAQVVLFHNIISSNLTLFRKTASGDTESTGMRNTGAILKEVAGQKAISVDEDLFSNMRDEAKSAGKSESFDDISAQSILDPILKEGPTP